MGNLFAGLSTGSSALQYYQRGIETAGHNVSNSQVEGFSRQRVNANAAFSLKVSGGEVGQGVEQQSITRIRDQFLDAQYVANVPKLGYWQQKVSSIRALEGYVGEREITAYQQSMDEFWKSLESLNTKPEDNAVRKSVIEKTTTMVSMMGNLRKNYDNYRDLLNEQVRTLVTEANTLIDDIALLNKDIAQAQGKGQNPNDLLDLRDLKAERLCKLTGATVGSPSIDEADMAYKIDLHGKTLVQGPLKTDCTGESSNVRHLVLVPMIGNKSYFDVQVEGNQYDHVDNLSVASAVIERNTTAPWECSKNGVHDLFVERLANGKFWTVGGGRGQLNGGGRLDSIRDPNQALGIEGSFGLQVGSAGVQVQSRNLVKEAGVALPSGATLQPGDWKNQLRIAGGSLEVYVDVQWNTGTSRWDISDGSGTLLGSSTGAGGALMLSDLQSALDKYPQLDARLSADGYQLTIEGANTSDMRGHILSITDTAGTLARDLGIGNKNPAVQINVTSEDTLTTIANKINAAYKSDLAKKDPPVYTTNPPGTPPMSPEEWLHANIIREPNGTYYLALTSNVAGEANRVNILSGDVCANSGDLSVARLLGFVEEGTNATSYMQLQSTGENISTINKDDPWAQDAYFVFNNRHYLSDTNSFAEARQFKTTDSSGRDFWENGAANTLSRVSQGIRLNLHGVNRFYDETGLPSGNDPTHITVRPHLQTGQIFSLLESRDDMILGFTDQFDELMYEMQKHVNAVHYSGHGQGDNLNTTGNALFKPLAGRYDASRGMLVNEEVARDLSLLAAGSGDGTGHSRGAGDGATALLMAQVKMTKVFNSKGADFNEKYLGFITDLGMQGQRADSMHTAQDHVMEQIERQRQSIMGVNSDEEMLDIIRFQQGVGAISRYMTALDEMLDRIINGMAV